jgi:GAF domain-containing protein
VTNSDSQSAADLDSRLHEIHLASQSLSHFLEEITVLAADVVDADCSTGITVIRNREPITVAASAERAKQLDEIQYGEGNGPCLHAARTGEAVTVHDSAVDGRWPAYLERAFGLGLRSSLSVPLALADDATGALNMYVFERHEFDDAERAAIGMFCADASRAVSLAIRYDELDQQNRHLHKAMASRRVIDQAIGLVMAQNRCNADEAFEILRRASQNRNVKLSKLAFDMIQNVSGSKPDSNTHWRP